MSYTPCVEKKDHFYITLYSNAAQSQYPDKTRAAFTIQFWRHITPCSVARWEVGLIEFSYDTLMKPTGVVKPFDVIPDKQTLIYCDLIASQFIGPANVRVLRTVLRPNKRNEWVFTTIQLNRLAPSLQRL